MENPREDLAVVLERITARITDLESRLSILESNGFVHRLPPSPAIREAHPLAQLTPIRAAGAIPAIGKMFLGIAGGYLLRSLAEADALPRLFVVLLALIYAAVWLVWAARMVPDARFSTALSATTAALIFSPMMWEVTLHFKVLPDAASAGVLTAFAGLAAALAWRRKLTSLAWIAIAFPAVLALMLLVATGDPAPFASSLILIALLTEYAALHDRWPGLRAMVALLADSAILLLILLYSGQPQAPPEYQPMNPAMLLVLTSALFVIDAIGIALSSVVLGRKVAGFEIGQTVIAFALAVVSALRVSHNAAAWTIGGFCFLLAGACYLAALTRFAGPLQTRNHQVFAAWGAALFVMGSFLLFPAATAALCLSAAAVAATLCGIGYGRRVLAFQGAIYLGIAAYASGLWDYAAGALAGDLPLQLGWSAWTTMFSVFVCCVAIWSRHNCDPPWVRTLLRIFLCLFATYTGAALAVGGMVRVFSGGIAPAAPALAVIRTLVLCMIIVGFSFSGARWNHAELIWIAYVTIAFCTLKLLYEDLRFGTAGSLAISLFLYGAVWVLVPRMVRSRPSSQNDLN